ncbi:hypothetical protein CRE_17757 [Caenorhabditis remanei]|uniref:Uncharacterized protein n=1 Tax=Caenorhabditis remanei TaxID=31234 RepID=E3NSL3_CAERE|nr:hypothetical protein CRE_17757 [Caenorhabditis remanei]
MKNLFPSIFSFFTILDLRIVMRGELENFDFAAFPSPSYYAPTTFSTRLFPAILACILLVGVLCQEPALLKAPILDRMSSNEAAPLEKEQVFTQLKNIINSAKFPWYKSNLHKVVKDNAGYMNSVDVGGDAGAKALEELKETRTKSENPQNVLDFLEICLEFMNKDTIPETSKWWFFNEAVIFLNRGYKLEQLKDLLIRRDWMLPVNVLEALEILYRTPTEVLQPNEIPKIPSEIVKNVYVAPTDPMVGPITLLGYGKLNEDWEADSFLRNKSMFQTFEDGTGARFLWGYQNFVENEAKAKNLSDSLHWVSWIKDSEKEGNEQYLKYFIDLREHEPSARLMEAVIGAYHLTNGSEFDSLQNVFRGRHSESLLYFINLLKRTPEPLFIKFVKIILKWNDTKLYAMKKFIEMALSWNEQDLRSMELLFFYWGSKEECKTYLDRMEPTTKKKMLELVEELRSYFIVRFCDRS